MAFRSGLSQENYSYILTKLKFDPKFLKEVKVIFSNDYVVDADAVEFLFLLDKFFNEKTNNLIVGNEEIEEFTLSVGEVKDEIHVNMNYTSFGEDLDLKVLLKLNPTKNGQLRVQFMRDIEDSRI